MATSQGSGPGRRDMEACRDGVVSDCGVGLFVLRCFRYRSRASGMLHKPPVQGLAPTGCQALSGWGSGFRALPGAVGHYG